VYAASAISRGSLCLLRYDNRVKFYAAILALSAFPSLFAQTPAMPKAPAPAAAPAPAPPPEPNKVVLTIGDQKITEGQFDDMIIAIPAQYQQYARGAGKRAFAEQIVQVKVLSQEAEKRKLDQQPKIKEEVAFQRENLLAQAMFLNLQEGVKVDDAAVEKYYNEHKNDYEVLKARHILIRVKGAPMQAVPGKPELTDEQALAKAQEIRKRLVANEDFATVAKAESDDAGSGAQGGDLGEFRKGMMVPPFEEAAFAAKVNEITQPVKTPFGYHLIKVESHTTKTLAEARPDIEKKVRPEIARASVESLRKGATVQMDDGFFGPATAAPAAPPAAAPGPAK
jgi:peptidyl-prolyl cis-trans isomerase C